MLLFCEWSIIIQHQILSNSQHSNLVSKSYQSDPSSIPFNCLQVPMELLIALLTLARIGGVEGYCSRSVCRQNSSEPTNISTLKILPADVKSYKDQM